MGGREYNRRYNWEGCVKGQGLITSEGVRFYHSVFIFFHSFMMPYQLIPLISVLQIFIFSWPLDPVPLLTQCWIHSELRVSGGTWLIWFLGPLKSPKLFRKLWQHQRSDFSRIFLVYYVWSTDKVLSNVLVSKVHSEKHKRQSDTDTVT